jgi:hypothetical protein
MTSTLQTSHLQRERAPDRGSFKNAAKMQQKCSKNVMQLERAPDRGSFKLGSTNAAQNVMQLERAPNRNPIREFLGLN